MAIRVSDAQMNAITPAPASAVPVRLDAPFELQARDNWCWAACCSMALAQQGRPTRQCVIAGSYVTGDCCSDGACNRRCAKTDVERVFRKNGLQKATFVDGSLDESTLADQLRGQGNGPGNTVAVGLEGSSNHMVLVVGVIGSVFNVNDPDPLRGTCRLSFAELKQDANTSRAWTATWRDLR